MCVVRNEAKLVVVDTQTRAKGKRTSSFYRLDDITTQTYSHLLVLHRHGSSKNEDRELKWMEYGRVEIMRSIFQKK